MNNPVLEFKERTSGVSAYPYQVTAGFIDNGDGTITLIDLAGVTDHGALTGLGDDDHSQYHNDARGDVRYSPLGHNHSGLYDTIGAASGAVSSHESTYDHTLIATALQAETDPISLHLDQATPQHIINGTPFFDAGINISKTVVAATSTNVSQISGYNNFALSGEVDENTILLFTADSSGNIVNSQRNIIGGDYTINNLSNMTGISSLYLQGFTVRVNDYLTTHDNTSTSNLSGASFYVQGNDGINSSTKGLYAEVSGRGAIGMQAYAEAGFGDIYGAKFEAVASGTANAYGIYATASESGSGTAYAGKFDGNVEVTGILDIQDTSSNIKALFNTSLLTTSDKTFAFPNASGTFALTSDLASFITGVVADSPLSGAGTSASHLTVDLSSKQTASSILSALTGLTYSSGSPHLRMTGVASFDLDTTTYEDSANKSTNVTTDGSSDTKYPSVKAIKDYADGLVAGLLDYRGAYDASGNTYPTSGGSGPLGAVLKGDMWVISVTGTLGGSAVQVGDSIIANVDTPGQTAANWNTLNANISYVPEDQANKVTSISGSSTDIQYPSAKLLYDQLAGKISTYASQTAKYFFAAPNASDGVPVFRAIVASDIPPLAYEAGGGIATHAALTTGIHGLAITAGQTLTVTIGGTLGSAAYTVSTDYATSAQGTLAANAIPKGTGTAKGDLITFFAASTPVNIADVAVGSYLRSGGVAELPVWSTLILPNAGTAYKLPVFSATNTMTELAAVGATGEYLKGNTGAIPSWAALNQAAVAGLTTSDSPTFAGLTLNGAITRVDSNGYFFNFVGATTWGIYWNTTDNQIEFHNAGTMKAEVDLDTGDITSLGNLTVDHILEYTAAHGVNIDSWTIKDGGAGIITGGINTFNITNGTANLDLAAGCVVNFDKSLAVSGADITMVGSGTATYTFSGTTGTLAQLNLSQAYAQSLAQIMTLGSTDSRATTPQPQDYMRGIWLEFKTNGVDSLTDGGSYHGLLTYRQWASGTDWTGGGVHQLGFTTNGNMWYRYGFTTNSWGSWYQLLKWTGADSTENLGTSSAYWANVYADRHYLNSTAYIDGAIAGVLAITGTPQLPSITSNPGSPADGMFWYRSDLDHYFYNVNGAVEIMKDIKGGYKAVSYNAPSVTITFANDDQLNPVAAAFKTGRTVVVSFCAVGWATSIYILTQATTTAFTVYFGTNESNTNGGYVSWTAIAADIA